MEFLFLLVLGFVGILFVFYLIANHSAKRDEGRVNKFIQDFDIQISNYERFWDGKYIFYEEGNGRLWVYNPAKETYSVGEQGQILGCELRINEETEFRTSITSAAGRAVLGGVLAGGIGAIIGGVTARKDSRQLVHGADLTIYFVDGHYDTINIFSDTNGVQMTDSFFRNKYDNGMAWCKFIESLTDNR
ncbi:hypothetical protein J2S74_000449 [Evansella vedderi]|uniref:Uncharacterized protein n=1 Tax=Evansella vedderi TaxID=38282 RepID=A0ABT9ZQS1_9BACI|nr:hypothetical protein [Evansella vedderi]MDQ0253077.1 hypothetical protein [Evansella vedderi]